jgi:ribonuclease D
VNAESAPQLITTQAQLSLWAERLRGAEWVAIDTESDSFHRYREKVCLIQMTALGEDVIIDPLAIDSLACLAPMLADPHTIKIFHDAGYDLLCLHRDFGFAIVGLFDTMLASRLLGERHFGLAALLRDRYGFEADKRQQRSDWAHRPLSAAQLHYARYDTHFLPDLALRLTKELEAAGRLSWALEDFARLPEVIDRQVTKTAVPIEEAFWRVQGARNLSPMAKGCLQQLYMCRERLAERLDRPAFKVCNDDVLLEMAVNPPHVLADFTPRPGLRRHGIHRFGPELLAALAHATPIDAGPPKGAGKKRRNGRMLDPDARDRYEALRGQRRVSAEALGLEPEVVLSNAILEDLARRPPSSAEGFAEIGEFRGWRKGPLVPALLACLASCQPAAPDDRTATLCDGAAESSV